MLRVRNMNVYFDTMQGRIPAVREFNLDIQGSKILSIVGESGSGKTVAMLAIMNLLPSNAYFEADEITFDNQSLLSLNPKQRRKFLGSKIGMIFQDPITSLDPCFKVGDQIAELFKFHRGMSHKKAINKAITLFEQVGIPDAQRRINSYPHQLSGGMNQRVMIAMAIALDPMLLIADEPTTALDVTIQTQILSLIKDIKQNNDMAVLLITHDMGVVAHMADQVITMYNGWQVEFSSNDLLFSSPKHPYTIDLLNSLPEKTIGNRLKTITAFRDAKTDGLNGCIYYPYCRHADEKCLQKISFNNSKDNHYYRCLK